MPEQRASNPQEQEFFEWLQHPATRRLRSFMHDRREELKETWASGAYTALEHFGTAMLNAKAIGQCQELDWFEQLEDRFYDLYEELESARSPG